MANFQNQYGGVGKPIRTDDEYGNPGGVHTDEYGNPTRVYTDEYGNPARVLTDEYEYGNPARVLTDEYGNPIRHTGTTTTAAIGGYGRPSVMDYDQGLGGGGHGVLHRSGSSSSSSEDDGQGGRRKKGIKEKIKEKLHKDDQAQSGYGSGATYGTAGGYGSGATSGGGYDGQPHEKKGIIHKIKDKLPGMH